MGLIFETPKNRSKPRTFVAADKNLRANWNSADWEGRMLPIFSKSKPKMVQYETIINNHASLRNLVGYFFAILKKL